MSTLFRFKGKERMLNQKCGTLPYIAPEVCTGKEYKAEPAGKKGFIVACQKSLNTY